MIFASHDDRRPPTSAQILARLQEMVDALPPGSAPKPLAEDELGYLMLLEHRAEERKYDRQRMSDWTALQIEGRWAA